MRYFHHIHMGTTVFQFDRTLQKMVRTWLLYLDRRYWAKTKNRLSHSAFKDMTPFEAFHGKMSFLIFNRLAQLCANPGGPSTSWKQVTTTCKIGNFPRIHRNSSHLQDTYIFARRHTFIASALDVKYTEYPMMAPITSASAIMKDYRLRLLQRDLSKMTQQPLGQRQPQQQPSSSTAYVLPPPSPENGHQYLCLDDCHKGSKPMSPTILDADIDEEQELPIFRRLMVLIQIRGNKEFSRNWMHFILTRLGVLFQYQSEGRSLLVLFKL